MSDDFQYQLTVSLPPSEEYSRGDMINIRAKTAQEFWQNLNAFNAQMVEEAANTVANIRAAWTVIRDAGGQVVQNTPSGAQNSPQSGYQPQGGGYPLPPQEGPQNGFQGPQQGYVNQQQPQQPANNNPSSPPNPPSCSHGVKTYKSGVKNGRTWAAWMCPAPKGDSTQHSPEWIDTNK